MYHFKPLAPEDLTPRGLILSMMNSLGTEEQSASDLVQAASIFGIEAPAVRVAASRLVREGLLETPVRGRYVFAAPAQRLRQRVQGWQTVSDRIKDWNGDWLVNLTHHLGRTDRRQVRTRERAMSLFGYREAGPGVWVRPANLVRSFQDHRHDLISLGAEPDIITLNVSELALPPGEDWRTLWSGEQLAGVYQAAIRAMTDSLNRLDMLPPMEAARETLLIGQAVIRAINLDPLLPEALCQQSLFFEMVRLMTVYNTAGRAAWKTWRERT